MKPTLPRSTPVVALVAAACLLIGSTGGAVAGSLITGKQIKDHSIALKDLQPKAVTKLKGQTGPAGPAGAAGAVGATGATGATGARGVSAWDTIPSGRTVTGFFWNTGRTGAGSSVLRTEYFHLPAQAPAAPILAIGSTTYGDPDQRDTVHCSGSWQNPTAAAGYACLYLGFASTAGTPYLDALGADLAKRTGFYMNFGDGGANNTYSYYGSWAYTAP